MQGQSEVTLQLRQGKAVCEGEFHAEREEIWFCFEGVMAVPVEQEVRVLAAKTTALKRLNLQDISTETLL